MSTASQMDRILDGSWLASIGMEQYQAKQQELVAFIKANQINVAMFVFFMVMTIRTVINRQKTAAKAGANKPYLDAPDFPEIEPLENFDWQKEEPIKLRRFSPKYHLTMGELKMISDKWILPNLSRKMTNSKRSETQVTSSLFVYQASIEADPFHH